MPVISAETIGPVTLVLGDCLYGAHVGEFVPPGTAAAIITDPPYCSGGFTEASRRTAKSMGVKSEALGWFEGDNMTTLGLQYLLRAIAIDSWTMLRKGGTLSLFMDWRMIPAVAPAIESARLRWQQLVVWDKKSAGLGNGFRAQHETLLHFAKGVPLYASPKNGNVLSVGRPREREHPTEKPVELLSKIIETVAEPGALIVDWFGGAGSTGVAAIETGRRAVVFEVDPVFHARAIERCRAALGQGKLFGPAQTKSEQDGLSLGDAVGAELEGQRQLETAGPAEAFAEFDAAGAELVDALAGAAPAVAEIVEYIRAGFAGYSPPADAFKAETTCERCRGEGWIRGESEAEDCPRCGGSGDAGVRDQCPTGHVNITCPRCAGSGTADGLGATVKGLKCQTCLGFGQVNFYALPEAPGPRTCIRTGQPLRCYSRLCHAAGGCTRAGEEATAGALL